MSDPFAPLSQQPQFQPTPQRRTTRSRTPFHVGQHGLSNFEKQAESRMAAEAKAAQRTPKELDATEAQALAQGIEQWELLPPVA